MATLHSKQSLVGFWKFKSNLIRSEDGSWFEDTISGGAFAFSEDDHFCTFFRSIQGAWGYSGTYTFEGSVLKLSVDSALSEDLEGKTLMREIEFKNPTELLYAGFEFHTGRAFKAIFVKVVKE